MKILKYKFLALDFDGIFTNNKVYCDALGNEFVRCCKYDSLALSIIKNYINEQNINMDIFIISSEHNKIVTNRANKLNLKVYQGINNKFAFLKDILFKEYQTDIFNHLIYLGNDINDLDCIKASSYSACPSDSPLIIKNNCNFVGKKKGGDGFIREVLQHLVNPLNLEDIY